MSPGSPKNFEDQFYKDHFKDQPITPRGSTDHTSLLMHPKNEKTNTPDSPISQVQIEKLSECIIFYFLNFSFHI